MEKESMREGNPARARTCGQRKATLHASSVKQSIPLLLLVLVLAVCAVLYWKRDRVVEYYHDVIAATRAPDAPSSPEDLPAPPPVSRLPAPDPAGVKQYAAPGTFYVVKRKKLESRVGIQAVTPGELVKLVQRFPDGRLRVTIDNIDFTMLPNEVTTDVDVAREAEKSYFDSLRSR